MTDPSRPPPDRSGSEASLDPPGSGRGIWRRLEPLVWLGLALFLLIRLGPQLSAWTGMGPPVGGGERVPSFQVTTLEGREYGTEALEGRVKVITFWATWCRVCHFELPAVQRVHEAWGGGEEVVVLGLSIDGGGKAVVRAHLEERGFTFPVAMADRGTRRAFGGIPGVPTTFIVDRQGIVRHTLVGVSGPGTLRRAVRRLVEEPPSPGGRVGVPPGEGSVP